MKMLEEFREFAVKGNVVDMAVGIMVGAAFTKIVSSFVADVVTPPLGLLLGGIDFTNFGIKLKEGVGDQPDVVLAYGKFIQTVVDFAIIAFVLFLAIKMINSLRRQEEAKKEEAPAEPPREERLLEEIRDLLREKV
jgi:large conductance mechanosensitive channel